MRSEAAPALWWDMPASGVPRSDDPSADLLGIDVVRVAAWASEGPGGTPLIQFGPIGLRGGHQRRRRRPQRSGLAPADVWEAVDGRAALGVVTSDATAAVGTIAEGRRLGALERLWLISPDLAVLDEVRRGSPACRLLHTCDPTTQPGGAERHAALLRESGIQGVMVPTDRVAAGLVALMHRFGRIVAADGAEHVRMVRAAVAAGADVVSGPAAAVLTEGLG